MTNTKQMIDFLEAHIWPALTMLSQSEPKRFHQNPPFYFQSSNTSHKQINQIPTSVDL